MSPSPIPRIKPRNLRISISSTASSSGDFSAGSGTPSSATTFSISPTSSLNPILSAIDSSPVKEEPFTPGLDFSDSHDEKDTSSSPGEEPKVETKSEDGLTEVTIPVKRGRGRPRKNRTLVPEAKVKIAKGRSKTGCLTCRRRKKKCDEGKPECRNCEKNGYICEGYSPKCIWRPGKDANAHRTPPFVPSLPVLIEGVESHLDRRLLNHFVVTVSPVLTQFNDDKNPFKELLLPLAIDNSGLMHSLLCLAGSHLARTDPTVKKAQYHHKDEAIRLLKKGIDTYALSEDSVIDDSVVATTMILCLEAICEGDNTGEHVHHITALNTMIQQMIMERERSQNPEPKKLQFAQFFFEFFKYHLILDSITSIDRRPMLDLNLLPVPFMQPAAMTLLGILDQMFINISKITALRDLIRTRKADGIHPTIDEVMLNQAVALDIEIRSWSPAQSPDQQPNRYTAALLYQQVTWLYLYRTIQRSVPDPKIRNAVDEGLKCLAALPADEYSYSVLLMPVFLLGCAAFDPLQRPEITKVFEEMKNARLQNAQHAQTVVGKIWDLMDQEDETSWDWERIIHGLGYDFLLS